MKVLVLNKQDIENTLSMERCIEIMAETFEVIERGEVVQPLRSVMRLPNNRGLLGMMPASLTHKDVMGIKVISVFPENYKKGLSSHQGVTLLFEDETGHLLAILDGDTITAIRTAAVSAVATRSLARADSSELALLGSGVQARQHLLSILRVRDIRKVKVWDIFRKGAEEFAERESRIHNVSVNVAETAEEAVRKADIICTVTSAKEPILNAAWVGKGTHINAVGACSPAARELDSETVARSKLFVDSRVSVLNESGDFLIPKNKGIIDDGHIQGELGEVLSGKIEGRKSAEEITLFESLGLAIEDLAASHYVFKRALEDGLGTYVSL